LGKDAFNPPKGKSALMIFHQYFHYKIMNDHLAFVGNPPPLPPKKTSIDFIFRLLKT